jgi:hypothetical protein
MVEHRLLVGLVDDGETHRCAPARPFGSSAMNYYRLYFLKSDLGGIERFAEFEAPDDDAALALAAEHEGEAPMELWCERRKVHSIRALSSITLPTAE